VPVGAGGESAVAEGVRTPEVVGSDGGSVGDSVSVPTVDAGGVDPVPSQVDGGNTSASGGEDLTDSAPIGAPDEVKEGTQEGAVPTAEEGSRARSRFDDRSLGEKIAGIHNTAAQVQQHLPEDAATVSAPTLNIQHGE
jgi:hypothetical protein